MADLLLYGSYGYTGSLIAERAVERGWEPVLAGRSEGKLREQAGDLGCEFRAFDLDSGVASELAGFEAVLNCAGPFADTYEPLVEACLAEEVHYLDITGELDVFQGAAEYDDRASEAGVMVLPGVGFDVVPTDCLAAHLAERLPSATHLALGFQALGSISSGTAKTALRYLDEGGYVRRDGRLERVPAASRTRRIDFGRGTRTAVTIPWGDLVTAYHSTDIPNVEVYIAVPEPVVWAMRGSRLAAPLLGAPPVRSVLEALVDTVITGPSERRRERARSYVWGEATDEDGNRVVSRLETPEVYALTVETALAAADRARSGDAPPGYRTPASAYGPDFVLAIDGVKRTDGT